MKTQLEASVFIAIMIIGTFAFSANSFIFLANATYVEGRIVHDTVWTLTDSPYLVIRDVIVESEVTLTVESNVEVRFCGNFSLVVRGILHAQGTAEKPIKFTSNKLEPELGDWNTIRFTSLQPSILENCIVEYGTNGITFENGGASITKSKIRDNGQNGIFITGDNNANIFENRIESNLNGIFIDGNTSGIAIEQNYIYSNVENGIYLYANETSQITNTVILNNTVSANIVGVYVEGRINADITKNSIAYNTIGVLYNNASNIRSLRYNDLYGNDIGARALSSAPVNAEHNYWGDASGPYHISLNPLGKGNPVESNGVDLDFIPFLTINNSHINQRPVAYLVTDKQITVQNDEVTFIGTLSEDDRQVYQYLFDFGDGSNSGWTTLSVFRHKYNSTGVYTATLMVMDDFGVTSADVAFVAINVTELTPLRIDLELGKNTAKYGESVSITVRVTDGTNPVIDANVALISVKGGVFQQTTGATDPAGYFTTTFTVPRMPQITDIAVIATASKNGYAHGSDNEYLRVLPPLLVQITTEPETIRSEDVINVKVHVTYDAVPINEAYVRASFNANKEVTKTGNTDEYGYCVFSFVAPQTLLPREAIIKASATKNGYIDGEAKVQKTIQPRTFDVIIKAEPALIGSGETSFITVNLLSNGKPVQDATVTLSSNSGGKISPNVQTTYENGSATFAFTAFGTITQRIATITAKVAKTGYVSAEAKITIIVEPRTSDVYIVQDTVWSLMDSPFVVVRDVIVEQNATLTIEPGVEVRFGGNFSLIVEGRLFAEGTEQRPITFTSNRLQPQPGDWNTIKFTDKEKSTLEFCIVEYATNGISIEKGSMTVENCTITNNLLSGVHIAFESDVTIKGNRIAFNQIGISIHKGTSGVTMEKNRIFYNSLHGIQLQADMIAPILNVLIFNNSLSTNSVAIYVSGWVDANITGNSISYNELGMSYENAKNMTPPRYNDIYGNTYAMNSINSKPINVENNYWGDSTGPYHVSLNPSGKGDPIGGDGVDIVFIPFLRANNTSINRPPLANMITDKSLVLINQTITFIATNSSDDGRVHWYFFDFGDGRSSGWITTSILTYKYVSVGTYEATLKIMDDFGVLNNNTAKVTLSVRDDLQSLDVDLTLSRLNALYGEQISLLVHVTSGINNIENAAVTIIALREGVVLPSFGHTNTTGYFATVFTAPNITRITHIRIIAVASIEGYADNSDYEYLQVSPPVLVQMTVGSHTVKSGESTGIAIHAEYNGEPASDADVALSFCINGNISTTSARTDMSGSCSFLFATPQTSIPLNVTITAVVTKDGTFRGETQAQIKIEPKILDIYIVSEPNTLTSEEVSTITVYVTSEGTPVDNANVVIYSDKGGEFSSLSKVTDINGNVTFVFTAPAVVEEANIAIVVTVTKTGYAVRNGTTNIPVKHGQLEVFIIVDSLEITPDQTSRVSVFVTRGGKPVPNAIVSVSAEAGVFSGTSGLTNSSGHCDFLFTAPKAFAKQTIRIVANATKLGYIGGEAQETMIIDSETAGFPLTTVLLIVIPIAIVAIFVVLIKLKIIVVSVREKSGVASNIS